MLNLQELNHLFGQLSMKIAILKQLICCQNSTHSVQFCLFPSKLGVPILPKKLNHFTSVINLRTSQPIEIWMGCYSTVAVQGPAFVVLGSVKQLKVSSEAAHVLHGHDEDDKDGLEGRAGR